MLDHPAREAFESFPEGVAFLNAAYMSPQPRASLAVMHEATSRLAFPRFGVDEFFSPGERVRALLAEIVGGQAERFSLTDSVSYGTALIAWNLRLRAPRLVGDRRTVLGVDGQFPSNVQTWSALESDGFRFDLVPAGPEATEGLLSRLGPDVALVAVEPLSWVDGLRLDLPRLAAGVRDAGALLLLDVTQSAGADDPLPDSIAADVVVGAGYKWLLGPYGTGFIRLSPALQEALDPLEWAWKNFAGSRDFNRLTEYATEFAGPAAKFDHGESSAFLRLPGWVAGLEVLRTIGPRAVREHDEAFALALRSRLDESRWEMSPVGTASQAPHLFRIAPRDSTQFEPIGERLAAAGVHVSKRAGGFRLSPHVYNGDRDLERLTRLVNEPGHSE